MSAPQAAELQRAFGLLREGRADEALVVGMQLAKAAPFAPDALQLKALCLAEAGRPDGAVAAFERALELAPEHPLILSNYAAMLRKAGRFAAALQIAGQAAQATPASAKAWLELAQTAHGARDVRGALDAARRALALQPDLIAAWQVLGHAARDSEDLEAAAEAFEHIVGLDPGLRSARTGLAMVHRRAGRADTALACLERAARELGPHPELGDAFAGALVDAGRSADAIAVSRALVRQHPAYAPAVTTLANLLWEYPPDADNASPGDVFRDAIRQQPENTTLRVAYVDFLVATRNGGEALEQVRHLRSKADRPWLALLEAQALDMLGETTAAGALHAALGRDAACATPAYLNAHARHRLRAGDPAVAAALALRSSQLDPGNQEALAYLATAWRVLDDAREFWLCDYDRLVALVDVEPPTPFSGRADFLVALKAALEPRHGAIREPMQQSLRGGSQTPGRLFGASDPVIEATQQALLDAVQRWLATLPDDAAHPFLSRNRRRVRMGGSWSVRLWTSGSHVNHIHGEGWISSAFYVSLPPSVVRASHGSAHPGAIQFGQPPLELELGLPPRRVITPVAGKLALFPSYMWHGTVPFDDEAPRMTVAFDMIPRLDHP